ncbi:MAG: hypothetical protein H7Y17_15535 [Chlorobia bacterium]|nr:hypothetical protein [Fimbriimonadaceae bacterium]
MLRSLFVASFVALSLSVEEEAFTLRMTGSAKRITGKVLAGKDYVALQDLASIMGAKVTVERNSANQRDLLLVSGADSKGGFDDAGEANFEIEADTSAWKVIPNTSGKMRVRDFTTTKESWNHVGELEVAPSSFLVEGRIPRGQSILSFYCVFKDAEGKTMDRRITHVTGVSFEGGKYPFTINAGNQTGKLPKTIGLRFNSAYEPGEQ